MRTGCAAVVAEKRIEIAIVVFNVLSASLYADEAVPTKRWLEKAAVKNVESTQRNSSGCKVCDEQEGEAPLRPYRCMFG